jgi:Cys-tRNA(Pro)/Cys-tRNA(Cys) deacylase
MARQATGGTPATVLLSSSGTPHTLHTYDHDPRAAGSGAGYGIEAATALGVDPGRVLKTLVVSVQDGGASRDQLAVAVLPVTSRLDLKALAAARGGRRASMAEQALAQRATGYVVGGISPLGQRRTLPTVVDACALDHATVYVSGGRRGLEVELSPRSLVALTGATTAVITA